MTDKKPHLARSIGLVDVVGLGVNTVVGQGIFLLPGLAFALLGPASLLALLLACVLCFLLALCFAEVASRFESTGGAYRYAKEAFGPLVGFEVGWMLCIVCVISWAALANGFTLVLAYFIPAVAEGPLQSWVAVGLMTLMALINLQGAKMGSRLSTVLSVAKLVPLLIFVAVGLLAFEPSRFTPVAPEGYENLAEGVLLLLYALVGFETSVVPAGEMEHPKRAIPQALISVMALVSFLYMGVFVACISLHPDLGGSASPVSEASVFGLGTTGANFIAAGIVLSVLGINAAQALVGPRNIYAMAERGDLPEFLAELHPRTGVPQKAILATLVCAIVVSLSGTFAELAKLGVLARFVQYVATCLALVVLRKRNPGVGFAVPGGPLIALVCIGLIVWLISATDPSKLLWGVATMLLGIPFYLFSRRPEKGRNKT